MRRDPAPPKTNGRGPLAPVEKDRCAERHEDVAKAPRLPLAAFARGSVPEEGAVAPESGWLGQIRHQFGTEIDKVQGIAIGAVLGVVRDVVTESAPELFEIGLADVIDGITVKLGGEPIHGPILNDTVSPTSGKYDRACASATQPIMRPCPTCGHRR